MTKKFKYVCKTASNYGTKGEVVALEIAPEDLSDRAKVMLKPYVEVKVKDLDEESFDVEAVKAEAEAEALKALAKVYEFVTGEELPGNISKPDTVAKKIIESLEANEDEQPE
ncbi:coil containing protein [Vibrio phage 1.214.O._10N.222.54.F11]|nr:coil containing protein [Vibrio phage 1.214.O._10N.222.54.F11]